MKPRKARRLEIDYSQTTELLKMFDDLRIRIEAAFRFTVATKAGDRFTVGALISLKERLNGAAARLAASHAIHTTGGPTEGE